MTSSDTVADRQHMTPPLVSRRLDPRAVVERKSCFLFGPRQTGKSTLIRQQFADCPVWNLLDQTLFLRLSRNPALIRESLADRRGTRIVVTDEIQRMPELLDEVHLLIEEHGIRFLLTGSSARRPRRKGVNLLGGRARSRALHPLLRVELGDRFDLDRALEHGLLPPIFFSESPAEDLAGYAGDYLREEVAAEALVRNIGAFSRFLEVAALAHGELVNFANMANDAQVPASTVREYYEILKDTLLAHEVPAFTDTRGERRSPRRSTICSTWASPATSRGGGGWRRERPSTAWPSRASSARRSGPGAITTGIPRRGTGGRSRSSRSTSCSRTWPSRSRPRPTSARGT